MHRNRFKDYLLLHTVVLVWGSTGLMGKLITAPAPLMVWYRVAIAAIAIAGYCWTTRAPLLPPKRLMPGIFTTGIMVGFHWMFFFESVKQSTVSVTMVCLATGPFFVAITGAIADRRRVHLHELLLGLASTIGVAFIFHFEYQYALGIALGVGASMMSSVFFVLNSRFARQGADSIRITYLEMGGALAGLTIYRLLAEGPAVSWIVSGSDFLYLLYLGVICTAFAFIGSIVAMRSIPPFSMMMTINLEPIYGILLALAVLGEDELMSSGFYVGAAIVLSSIALNAAIKRRIALRAVVPDP